MFRGLRGGRQPDVGDSESVREHDRADDQRSEHQRKRDREEHEQETEEREGGRGAHRFEPAAAATLPPTRSPRPPRLMSMGLPAMSPKTIRIAAITTRSAEGAVNDIGCSFDPWKTMTPRSQEQARTPIDLRPQPGMDVRRIAAGR